MKKLNIAEILENCPKGMKLYSPIFGDVYLDKIRPHLAIVVTIDTEQGEFKEEFLYDGRYRMNGECMLFPSKEQRDWSKFQKPFNDGDIVATANGNWIGITTGGKNNCFIPTYCVIQSDDKFEAYFDEKETWVFHRLATEAEKEKLFKVIKENGYKWNSETKTLEKLIKPKFKVGDRIKYKKHDIKYHIINEENDMYIVERCSDNFTCHMYFKYVDDEYELIPNKFDISTLKPFDKVLVRDTKEQVWVADLFSHVINRSLGGYTFACVGHYPNQCIPYECNEFLLGTTNDCAEYFKTWE